MTVPTRLRPLIIWLGLLLPKSSTWRIAALALLVSVVVEVSQLSKAPWIESIRCTTIGGLVLGFDFVWTDLSCFVVGVGLGLLIESAWRVRTHQGNAEGRG